MSAFNLRHVGCINPVLVVATQHRRDANSSRELLREGRPGTLGSITSVRILAICDLVGPGVVGVPGPPARGVNDVGHAGVLDDDTRVVSPRATEEVRTGLDRITRGRGDLRVVDYVV